MPDIIENIKRNQPGDKPVLITRDEQMNSLCEKAKLVSQSNAPILITGESGTGKEVFSRLIHYYSERRDNSFVALNCGAIAKDIVESELFGHEKGAFTGAVKQKEGCFELADKGTLFLDEIAEMKHDMQVKLLRAVENKMFRRVGGSEEIETDTRIISATNKNISELIKSGEFREDLFYRLSVIELHIPPLRERRKDIPFLARYFLSKYVEEHPDSPKEFSEQSLEMMTNYDWPGNVRELKNIVERCAIMCPEKTILPKHLHLYVDLNVNGSVPEDAKHNLNNKNHVNIEVGTSMEEAEKMLINHTLSSVDNNKSEAARILGVSRKTLHNKLAKFSENGH